MEIRKELLEKVESFADACNYARDDEFYEDIDSAWNELVEEIKNMEDVVNVVLELNKKGIENSIIEYVLEGVDF